MNPHAIKREEIRRSADRFAKHMTAHSEMRMTAKSVGRYKGSRDADKASSVIESNKNLMLDLVNKVEMFRIVTEKVNQQLVAKKKPPVFKLSTENDR